MKNTKTRDDVALFANETIIAARGTVARFAKNLGESQALAHDLQWSGAAFTAAARAQVWVEVLVFVTNGGDLDKLVAHAVSQAIPMGDHIGSPTHALMADEIRVAWGRVFDYLTRGF